MTRDEEQLNLVSVFYYVVAALAGLFSCIPFIHIAIGIAMLAGVMDSDSGEDVPAMLGWVFVLVGSVIVLMGFAFAVMLLFTGRFLARRRHYTFCLAMAAASCIFMPFGTILGVFTIIVLSRPEAKALFS